MNEYSQAKKELDALYAELPTIECKGKCWDACGPIFMSKYEWRRILRHPRLKGKPEPRMRSDFSCPLLTNNRCMVYRHRPMICRLWGIVESLPCPWDCKPEPRYLSHVEGHDFLLRAELISEPQAHEEIEKMRAYMREHPEQIRDLNDIFVNQPVKTHS